MPSLLSSLGFKLSSSSHSNPELPIAAVARPWVWQESVLGEGRAKGVHLFLGQLETLDREQEAVFEVSTDDPPRL